MSNSNPTAQALAARVRRQRLDRGLTQAVFATMAAMDLRTYIRFEHSGTITLHRLVRVFDALGLKDQIDQLAPLSAAPAAANGLLFPVRQRGRRAQKAATTGGVERAPFGVDSRTERAD